MWIDAAASQDQNEVIAGFFSLVAKHESTERPRKKNSAQTTERIKAELEYLLFWWVVLGFFFNVDHPVNRVHGLLPLCVQQVGEQVFLITVKYLFLTG